MFDLGIVCANGHGTWRYTSNAACIECSAIRATQRGEGWQQRNKDAKRRRYQEDAAYREILKERTGTYYRNVVAVDPERMEEDRERGRRNYRRNPGATALRVAQRNARSADATPYWLTPRQRREMESFYERAANLTKVTCIPHEVDHIVPLQARTVCGLNVPWNLQVLTAEENRRKRDGLPWAGELICRVAKGYRGRLVKSY
jgi:5-methylcytosine-specific restriction endonuclease McrA